MIRTNKIVLSSLSMVFIANIAMASDIPTYEDGVLTIPRVDSASDLDKYQDVVLEYRETGQWELTSYTSTERRVFTATVDSISVIKTSETPIQVFLKVNGGFSSGCSDLDEHQQAYNNNHFNVVIQTIKYPDGTLCTAAQTPIETFVDLDVYSLDAGTYTYNVNGSTGTFTLDQDNVIQSAN